ncbi:YesL family protein [Gracilibacillus thailandensis]|nr:YesL family protein [Gracilibacillus thailandensis]
MMELSGIWAGFYRISVWVTRFAWLNMLWIAFTLLGLIFFGIMPATIAMFAVVRKWVLKEYDVPVFETFFKQYKSNFLRANLFGLVIYIIGYFLSVFLKYTGLMNHSSLYPVLLGIFVIAAFLYVMLVLYIAPVYVHYQLRFWQYIRYAVSIGAVNLHYSICALTVLAGIYFASLKLPGITLFFSFSVSAYVAMFIIHIGFSQLLKKQQEQLEQTPISTS